MKGITGEETKRSKRAGGAKRDKRKKGGEKKKKSGSDTGFLRHYLWRVRKNQQARCCLFRRARHCPFRACPGRRSCGPEFKGVRKQNGVISAVNLSLIGFCGANACIGGNEEIET